ncbi:hypothetical protein SEA_BASILISK_64 [Arthrobacter phage Basilisk]|nr:hypothetical protein SEA_BASILISK_64 [Arthrobacter phage Basilisk]
MGTEDKGKPADVVIREDGTTWVRVERYGVAALVNLEELRRSPVVGRVYVGPVGAVPVPPVADYMWRASVVPGLIGTGYTFGGGVL